MEKEKLIELYQILGSFQGVEEMLESAIVNKDWQKTKRILEIVKKRNKKLEELIDSEYYKDC